MSAMSLLIFTKSPLVQNWLGLPTLRSYRIVSYCASIGMVNYIRTESWFSLQYGGEKKGHTDKGTPSKKVHRGFLATCYLLNLGATRRYPELRGFAPFVIVPKLVMNSTIC